MTAPLILIIEDEKNIIELVRYNLEKSSFRVLAAKDGEIGLEKALKESPSLILLDLMLPGVDGIEVCKILKQNYKTQNIPIITMTAKSEEPDIILGFELGADDYVAKPFSPRQLIARIRAVLRRSQPKSEDYVLKVGALEMDSVKHCVNLNGAPVELTFKEYGILELLLQSHGRVLSREHILENVWGHDESLNVELRAVDKHVAELRKKLKKEADRIMTIKNYGYRFEADEFSKV